MITYFTEKDIVEFGNYLLSDKRNSSISEFNQDKVTHADIENWKHKENFQ